MANFVLSDPLDVLQDATFLGAVSLGALPAQSGTLRLANADSIVIRNANNTVDTNVLSTPLSDEFDFLDATMPLVRIQPSTTQVKTLRVQGVIDGERTTITRRTLTVATPSGSSVISVGHIPAGSLVLAVSTRVTTAVTGPAGFDVGDGVDVDRWGNSLATGLGQTSAAVDQTNSLIQMFPALNNIVITSDGVDFTGGAIQITVHYISFAAATS